MASGDGSARGRHHKVPRPSSGRLQAEAQQNIGAMLRGGIPEQLDEVSSAAVVGAFIGAVAASVEAIQLTMPDAPPENKQRARRDALRRALSADVSNRA